MRSLDTLSLTASDRQDDPSQLTPIISTVDTGGGVAIQRDVNLAHGDFVARDKIENKVTIIVQTPDAALQVQQQFQQRRDLLLGNFARKEYEPETVLVEAGAFLMGSDRDETNEAPQHEVTLPDFRMGKYPVTVREFAAFVKETKAVEWVNAARDAGWFDLKPLPAKLDHPVTGVSWYDALAYCEWLSSKTSRRYRLPSEAEWEKAATWLVGAEGNPPTKRQYPWGEEWGEGRCNTGGTETTPVTAHRSGASAYECEDLLGNVQEWTRSLWGSQPQQPDYGYPYGPGDSREVLRVDDLPAQVRLVHRGGSYNSQPADLRCTARRNATPNSRVAWRGFRVVIGI